MGYVARGEVAPHRAGVVLVGLQPDASPARRAAIEGRGSWRTLVSAARIAAVGRRAPRIGPIAALRVRDGSESSAADAIRAMAGVRFAELDYLQTAGATPNDPGFGSQWAFANTGQTINGIAGTAGADEHARPAWDLQTGSRSIVVGETDTGVDYKHPDLAANVWTNPGGIGGCAAGSRGYNVVASTCDPMDNDTSYGGHGTHVAGILGAVGNNSVGVTGVNWATSILPVKWLDSNGNGSTSQLIAALDWLLRARQAGVNLRVVNDSATFVGTAYSQALSDEIDLLGANDVLFVTAAGNTGDNNDDPAVRRYPCGYDRPTEICVTASDQNDQLPSWANYGASTVDLAAPGANVYSTLRGGTYGTISGGSMASPQVAGAAALVLASGYQSAGSLKSTILGATDPLAALSGKVRTGGRLDICKALPGCASAPPPPSGKLGKSSVGGSSDSFAPDRKRVNRYDLAQASTVSKLSVYLAPTGRSGSQLLKTVVYSDVGGSPGRLLAVSRELTFRSTDAAGWFDTVLAAPLSLAAGGYWIGVITGDSTGVAGFRYDGVSGSRKYNANSYAAGPSDPFGTPTTDSEQTSLYATYTTP